MKCTYGTGVYAPDGYEEQWTEDVCDECQKAEGVHKDGCVVYCDECYEAFLERRREDELEDLLEYWSEQEARCASE